MNNIKGIIDRFEGDIVVVEINGKIKNFPKSILPEETQIGDVLIIDKNKIAVDKKETEKRRKDIQKLMNEVWED